jgi:uncharacterized membrane protein
MKDIGMLELGTLLSALGCSVIAGVFFAFSTFVMKALGKLPPPQGIAAMQSINIAVINPWFMTAFFGTALLCIVELIAAFRGWQEPAAPYLLAGSVLYLVGTILVTIVFNVPRNNALAAASPPAAEAAALWSSYLSTWTFWNHVRTIAALAACALFMVALWIPT